MTTNLHQPDIQWVKTGVLARSCRPSYWDDATLPLVQEWLDEAGKLGIKSILCLLSQAELDEYYGERGIELLAQYKANGFKVGHVPVVDEKVPPLSEVEKSSVGQAFEKLPKPCLIHCSAGCDRTGASVQFLLVHPQYFSKPKKGKAHLLAKRVVSKASKVK